MQSNTFYLFSQFFIMYYRIYLLSDTNTFYVFTSSFFVAVFLCPNPAKQFALRPANVHASIAQFLLVQLPWIYYNRGAWTFNNCETFVTKFKFSRIPC
jgi:hypothetical protein